MRWWDEKAGRIQQGVRMDESKISFQHTEEEARSAAVRTREDVILLVSHLSSANSILASIRFLLFVLTLVVIAIGAKVAHYW
jgi:hypothetical protein